MPTDRAPCAVCADPGRYVAEQRYIDGLGTGRYSRAQLERHMAHVTDAETLRAVTDIASASAVASRLRALESLAYAIIDRALVDDDGKLALAALREARQVLGDMARLSDALVTHDVGAERPDLDAAIAAHLGVSNHVDDSVDDSVVRTPLALPPAE